MEITPKKACVNGISRVMGTVIAQKHGQDDLLDAGCTTVDSKLASHFKILCVKVYMELVSKATTLSLNHSRVQSKKCETS